MGTTVLAFCAIFVLIASSGLLLFYREAMIGRISDAITGQSTRKKGMLENIQQSGLSLGGVVEQFERILPRSQAEASIVQQRLIRAGFRTDTAVKIFYGAKVVVPLALCSLVLATGLARQGAFFIYATTLGLGFLAPDFWLGKRIAARQKKIRLGLPDALDLLVICIEAGLSLDQAVARTSEELGKAQPAISDEMGLVVLEQRAGRARSEAWKHMAERTDENSVRSLVSMLVQSEQFGTSVAKTLRVHSDTLRTQRIQQVEEMAAKTTIKLLFPLVLFIFPSLFLVTLGPAVILMSESFKTLFNN